MGQFGGPPISPADLSGSPVRPPGGPRRWWSSTWHGAYRLDMAGRRCPGSLGDVLASRRSGLFVGRGSEVELFRAALDAEPAFSVLHLHGPGGIGKTTLLDAFADLALHAGAQVVRLDGRDVHAQSAVLAPLREFLETSNHRPRLVWLVDTYDQMSALDDWIRTEVLPRLPATTVTVVAGRLPPGQGWRADPAWRDLLRIMSLRNLRPAESRQYLQLCGVDVALHDRIVEVSHGHPLGLSLLADVVKRGGEPVTDPAGTGSGRDTAAALRRRGPEHPASARSGGVRTGPRDH